MGKEKICDRCFTIFFSESGKERFCAACKRKKRQISRKQWQKIQTQEKAKTTPKISIDDVLRWSNAYHRRTGIYLSYAKAVEEMKKEGYAV